MVYPTLLAAIGDVAHPNWRARAVGIYRLWRDGGFAVGAILAGVIADAAGITTAIWAVAALTAASGHRRRRPHVRNPPPRTAHRPRDGSHLGNLTARSRYARHDDRHLQAHPLLR